jgi:hypothetical protein
MTALDFGYSIIIRIHIKLPGGEFVTETEFLYSDLVEESCLRSPAKYVRYMLEVQIKASDSSTHVLLPKTHNIDCYTLPDIGGKDLQKHLQGSITTQVKQIHVSSFRRQEEMIL